MQPLHRLKMLTVLGTMLAILGHAPRLDAGSPPTAVTSVSATSVTDVRLGNDGRLSGLVVDVQGIPVSQATVVLRRDGRELASVRSDRQGQFLIADLQGGTYQLLVGSQRKSLRVWAAETAPPQARSMAVVVVSDQIYGGQMPVADTSSSRVFVATNLPTATPRSSKNQPQSL